MNEREDPETRPPDYEHPGGDHARSRGAVVVIGAAVLLAALIVWGYVASRSEAARARDTEAPGAVPSRTRTVDGETVVEMGARARERGGIVVAPAPASGGGGVTGYGRVIPLDTLAALHDEYVSARSAAAQAGARAEASRREYDRLSALHADEQNVSARAVEEARAAMLADQAALAAAAAPARTLAAAARQDWGAVVGDWITRGSAELGRLMDGRDVLVQVTVPFGAIGGAAHAGAALRGGDTSAAAISRERAESTAASSELPPRRARLETGPGATVDARYISVAARADPAIQGPSFYYVAAASPTLIPGMNVTAVLAGDARAARGAAIPDSAIVWTDGAPWVYVQLDSATFVRRRVAIGVPAVTGGSFVTTIAPGTPIVVRGAQVLLSEELRSRIQGSGDEDES